MTTLAPTRNVDLFARLADHFDANPETHRQTCWGNRSACSTVGCVAGWTLMLTYGVDVAINPDGVLRDDWDKRGGPWADRGVLSDYDQWEPIRFHAARLLGLTHSEAELLFDSDWQPATTVAAAMRALAEGYDFDEACDDDFLAARTFVDEDDD